MTVHRVTKSLTRLKQLSMKHACQNIPNTCVAKKAQRFMVGYEWIGRSQWHPTLVLLPGKSHGRRSLVGCSPWGLTELNMAERLHFHFSLSCIGEGNGNPLQCSCLENPRDRGAWWAADYGVSQSQTWLKWLSSSSSSVNELKNHDSESLSTENYQLSGEPPDYLGEVTRVQN